jgi:hypothetical protein
MDTVSCLKIVAILNYFCKNYNLKYPYDKSNFHVVIQLFTVKLCEVTQNLKRSMKIHILELHCVLFYWTRYSTRDLYKYM